MILFLLGITAPLVSTSVVRAFSVSIYSYTLPYWSKVWLSIYDAPPVPRENEPRSTTMTRILKTSPMAFSAGSLAGFTCSSIAAPFEFTKLASQIELLVHKQKNPNAVSSESKPNGTFTVARNMIKRHGVASLYSGYKYHICEYNDSLSSC